ncbi:hypothetical protein SRABI76_01330 [Microbacterium oxydans]|uniref:Uncharacterized protein n=1 Tax=Microbacterium oxydans TaxID=82380 RepID=A0A0F0LA29_9MICO|nr:hypothetical protein [Microbacterium oxydans]KJL30052.1 hypothetical protein RS83_01194 [Microbacterium oxydans]CAH0172991.1 hypothetical protein SRABI76_01330 [Microbacterium oxydans]
MDRDESDAFEPYRQDFAQMPGINGNEMTPSFRELSPSDTTKRGMLWSSIGVGALVVAVGVFFLGDWLHWF